MKSRLRLSTAKSILAGGLAATVFAGVLASATPASAAVQTPPQFDRTAVIKRAKVWTGAGIGYSQVRYWGGYRRDCSGFVSWAWGLPYDLVTWQIPNVAKRIGKNDLRRGDVLLNVQGDRHVVIFEKWADWKHTKYWVLEETGQNGVDRAIRRVVPYPYRYQGSMYKPYRYVGMGGYYLNVRRGDRQLVKNGAYYARLAAWRKAEGQKAWRARMAASAAAKAKPAPAAAPAPKPQAPAPAAAAAPAQPAATQAAPNTRPSEARPAAPSRATSAPAAKPAAPVADVNPMVVLMRQIAQWMTGQ